MHARMDGWKWKQNSLTGSNTKHRHKMETYLNKSLSALFPSVSICFFSPLYLHRCLFYLQTCLGFSLAVCVCARSCASSLLFWILCLFLYICILFLCMHSLQLQDGGNNLELKQTPHFWRDLQDGGRVRRGDHLPPHKYIRNTSTCGTTPTEHLLNADRRPQTSPKARKSPCTRVGQKKKQRQKNRDRTCTTGRAL